ncbi:MAG: MBL fold metallo-hydrolase [Burkholderiales bacterium]
MTIAQRLARAAHIGLLTVGLMVDAGAQPAPTTAIAPALSLVVLGSGGPGATGRAGSSYLVLVDGTPRILVDAGPGSFARLGESRLSLAKVDVVLLTHLHIDHVGELPGLFKARAVSSNGPIRFQVFGPDGRKGTGEEASFPSTTRFVDLLFGANGAFGYLRDFSAPMTIQPTDISATVRSDATPTKVYADGDLVVSAIAGHHRDAPAVIYRIDHAGKSITFSGDIDAEGLPDLRRIARGTSLLVFNSVVLDPPGSPAILYTLHTPPKAIGEVADEARADKLLLSHLSPMIDKSQEVVLTSIARSYKGLVVFAADGLTIVP